MARPDPLQAAAAYYTAKRWDEQEWRDFGRETGTSDILASHPRLYRSLSFGDDDYPDAALEVLERVLTEGVGDSADETERMELLADAMPDLPSWTAINAPTRTQRLFQDYLAARDPSEVPAAWELESEPSAAVVEAAASWPNPAVPETGTTATEPAASWDLPQATVGTSSAGTTGQEVPTATPRSIFIVHGHDEAALNSIRVYVFRETGIMPVSLAEEAGLGRTIIEKFETHGSQASYVIVLLTPDDVGQTVGEHDAGVNPNPRARQNVVLELGYFIGAIGRENIVVIDADVERPSDLAGLSYVQYPGTNWKDDLRRELVGARLT